MQVHYNFSLRFGILAARLNRCSIVLLLTATEKDGAVYPIFFRSLKTYTACVYNCILKLLVSLRKFYQQQQQ